MQYKVTVAYACIFNGDPLRGEGYVRVQAANERDAEVQAKERTRDRLEGQGCEVTWVMITGVAKSDTSVVEIDLTFHGQA